ncbi:hypothetical protein G6F68_013975 [Rhizopus microsporus]|nr:hypothetical protein G6F68_013975 [Rhizopus microsporus]
MTPRPSRRPAQGPPAGAGHAHPAVRRCAGARDVPSRRPPAPVRPAQGLPQRAGAERPQPHPATRLPRQGRGLERRQAAARIQRRCQLRCVLVGGEECRRGTGQHHERWHAEGLRAARRRWQRQLSPAVPRGRQAGQRADRPACTEGIAPGRLPGVGHLRQRLHGRGCQRGRVPRRWWRLAADETGQPARPAADGGERCRRPGRPAAWL